MANTGIEKGTVEEGEKCHSQLKYASLKLIFRRYSRTGKSSYMEMEIKKHFEVFIYLWILKLASYKVECPEAQSC